MSYSLAIVRTIAAPIDRAWAAWTDPTLLPQWSWAGIGQDASATVELAIGGAYRVCTQKDGDAWCFRGEFEHIEAPSELTATLVWEADVGYTPGVERIDVALSDNGDGTTSMVFRHEGIPIQPAIEPHTVGWNSAFDDLDKLLSA